MSQISWIDGAIKSLVEVPQRSGTRKIYTRAQLLSYRYTPNAQKWPPTLDKRFARGRLSCNPQQLALRRIQERKFYLNENRITNGERSQVLSEWEALRYYDDAIVSACAPGEKLIPNKSESDKGFYDQPNTLSSTHERSKYMRFKHEEPEWFVCGPEDVEEGMELPETNTHSGSLQKSAKNVKDLFGEEEEKENDLLPNQNRSPKTGVRELYETASGDQQAVRTLDDRLKATQFNQEQSGFHRGDRQPNIKTLREIESKLKINRTEAQPAGDMSAYHKLLGLVGGKTNEQFFENLKSDRYKRIPSESSSGDKTPCGDPAVSEIILDRSEQATNTAMQQPEGTKFRTPNIVQSETSAHPACNPLAASYQRQVIASGPLGQNALRWFKAMTNAASANACINQTFDGTTQTEPSEGRRNATNITESDKQSGYQGTATDHYTCGEPISGHRTQNRFAETQNALNLPNPRSNMDLPFYLRTPEQAFGTPFGLGMGYNLSPRPVKPLMFYYHPQAAQLLGRPMLNPLLLQQIIQRQMDIRTAALQWPLHYLRTQSMVPSITESYYSTLFGQNQSAKTSDGRKSSTNNATPANLPPSNVVHGSGRED